MAPGEPIAAWLLRRAWNSPPLTQQEDDTADRRACRAVVTAPLTPAIVQRRSPCLPEDAPDRLKTARTINRPKKAVANATALTQLAPLSETPPQQQALPQRRTRPQLTSG